MYGCCVTHFRESFWLVPVLILVLVLDRDSHSTHMPITIGEHGGKPCVVIGNAAVSVKVATSGCQIVSILPTINSDDAKNPLWEPPWTTTTAALRKVAARNTEGDFSQDEDDVLESELLSCIGGHSLCCDVFGAHADDHN